MTLFEIQHLYDSPKPVIRQCVICGVDVPSEQNVSQDKYGKTIIWYTPASRYWNGSGVFCSADHSLEHYRRRNLAKNTIT